TARHALDSTSVSNRVGIGSHEGLPLEEPLFWRRDAENSRALRLPTEAQGPLIFRVLSRFAYCTTTPSGTPFGPTMRTPNWYQTFELVNRTSGSSHQRTLRYGQSVPAFMSQM